MQKSDQLERPGLAIEPSPNAAAVAERRHVAQHARPAWLPIATLVGAVLFWLAAAILIHNHVSRTQPAGTGATGLSAVWPAATGRVSVRDDGPAREYSILSAHAGLMMPAVAPNGDVWLAEMDTNRLAQLDPSTGQMREYALPGSHVAGVMGTAVDGQGGVWYTEASRGAIGVYETATNSFSEFSTGNDDSSPGGIAIDAAGNVWFTELAGAIGEFDVHSAQMHQLPIPTPGSAPYALAIDGQGKIWFTEFGANRIGRLDPATGSVQDWPTPSADSGPAGIAIAKDGSIWFSESNTSALGHLTAADGTPADEQIREFPLPAARRPSGIAVAPDGSVWLSGTAGSVLTEFDPATTSFHELTLPTPDAGIFWLATGPNDVLWADEANLDANKLVRVQLPLTP